MINLIKVEFTRLFKSKFFVVSFALCLILSVLAGLIVFVDRESRNDLSSLEAALESINITSNSGLIACIVMVAFISSFKFNASQSKFFSKVNLLIWN